MMWSINKAIQNSPPIEVWPTVNTFALEEGDKEKFLAYKKSIELYFAGELGVDIEKKTGVTRTYLPKLARKCLELASDGQIFGFRALIPYIRIRSNERKTPLEKKRRHQHGGQSGALTLVLKRFPSLYEELVKNIFQESKKREIREFRIAPKSLHNLFLSQLKEHGVGEDEWPFNTQYKGVRTIQRFMAKIIDENFAKAIQERGESPAKAHVNLANGESSLIHFSEPFDAVEIDAYRIDAFLTAAFETPEGTETDVLLERLWLIAAVDRASTAILAYTIVYRSEVTASDVIRVIRDAVSKKWTPMNLTIPLEYPKKGGLPSGVIPETYGTCWNILLFDGALAHLAKAIHDEIRKMLGFSISWGASGHFERRPNVERTFGKISKDIFKRLPSTTGSNPLNGRASNAESTATRDKIRASEAEQLLDIYIAMHNCTPSEGISFLSPIEFIEHFVKNYGAYFQLRTLPKATIEKIKMVTSTLVVTVRGSIKDGRRPYIQLDRVHYTSPILSGAAYLIGQKLIVEIDEDDYRQVRAFLSNGAELGFLNAQGRWALTKHSVRTRRTINTLLAKRILALSDFEDPVRAYLKFLSTRDDSRKTQANSLPRRKATEAIRVSKESNITPKVEPKPPETSPINSSNQTVYARKSLLDTPSPIVGKIRNSR